eukprot:CAMPEP_0113636408 /NCGR_PEP_ID=MMETSP0017_2-20120614/19008_1 /TAXON_ID=2856 /ORGANISM="Cylindrotheca closterium" /LENGTH=319 /DNA_ID=CAMNT_0000547289 /DNA_START=44 /DNA_END=1003 /DNA_ORIENTATION=+ /assembly_acc=CAM_ASM_000147
MVPSSVPTAPTPAPSRRVFLSDGEIFSPYGPFSWCGGMEWLERTDRWTPPEDAENPEALWVERYHMAKFYYECAGDGWANSYSWLSAGSVCDWEGVDCDDSSQVSSIDLLDNTLRGNLHYIIETLTHLEHLKFLNLRENVWTGTIPTSIGLMTNLEHLNLALNLNHRDGHIANGWTGIPSEIGSLTNLEFLDLGANGVTGTVPSAIFSLTNLKELYLENNALTGTVSSAFGSLTKLETLDLARNLLSGELPSEMSNLEYLTSLECWENKLIPPMPPSLIDCKLAFDSEWSRQSEENCFTDTTNVGILCDLSANCGGGSN